MTSSTHPACYRPCKDLWCITTYFNPQHYHTRQVNHALFAERLVSAGIPLLTVECAFKDDPFELPPGPDVIQVRSPHVLWQKERLINLAVSRLPDDVEKVAWLDGDILFTNPDWAVETARLLDEVPVVQPFEQVIRLHQGQRKVIGNELSLAGFARVVSQNPETLQLGGYYVHGHTGFVWAARRELLAKHGLYEAFINGVGDHYIAHAMCADFASPCMQRLQYLSRLTVLKRHAGRGWLMKRLLALIPRTLKANLQRLPGIQQDIRHFGQHFLAWAVPFGADVGGRLGWVPGSVLHLWHGDSITNRQHGEGWVQMHTQGFDPAVDVRIGPSGCLEWASDKPALHQWEEDFFALRREDG
jgi:hypothetical protein